MANILLIKRRMKTAQSVSKTTKALQMIATSKLKKAQDAAVSSRSYVEKLSKITKNLTGNIDEKIKSPYMKSGPDIKKTLLIVMSPDKGLCGGMVTNLTKELLSHDSNSSIRYLTIGKKLEGPVAKLNQEIIGSFDFGTTLPSFDKVYPIAKIIDNEFLSGNVSEVKILYSNFITVFTQMPKIETILPIKLEKTEADEEKKPYTIFEPSAREILPEILRHYLEMNIYQFLLESYASEQAARMIAMKNATDNAEDIIDYLTLEYNKQRQEKITNEILDIGSGAAAIMYE